MIRDFLIPGQNWTFAELCLHSSCHGCAEITRCAREHKRQRHFTHSCIYFVQYCWLMQSFTICYCTQQMSYEIKNMIKFKKWESCAHCMTLHSCRILSHIKKTTRKMHSIKKQISNLISCILLLFNLFSAAAAVLSLQGNKQIWRLKKKKKYFCVQILFVVSVFWICGLDISIYLELWKSLQTVRGQCLGHRAYRFVWVSWQRNHEREKRKEVGEHGLCL